MVDDNKRGFEKMANWYYVKGREKQGPVSREEIEGLIATGAIGEDTLLYTSGMSGWKPMRELRMFNRTQTASPPPVPSSGASGAHEIDYQIVGEEMQFVEIELDPGESAVAEAGSMMYMSDEVAMSTVFGDGSVKQETEGFMGKLLGAGKRLITGESLFTTVFTHSGAAGKKHVAFASPYPGKIIPLHLKEIGGQLICQKDAFLAAAKGVSIGIHFQKKLGVGLFGGEGFIMEKLEGDGWVFVHAGGTIVEKELKPGEMMRVDTGCLVAIIPSVNYDIEYVGNVKSAIFGGEGFFFATLRGPGRVWLQSLPFSRLAGRVYQAMPKGGGKRTGEGSILGGVGDFIDGD